jgi:hypothetical protein
VAKRWWAVSNEERLLTEAELMAQRAPLFRQISSPRPLWLVPVAAIVAAAVAGQFYGRPGSAVGAGAALLVPALVLATRIMLERRQPEDAAKAPAPSGDAGKPSEVPAGSGGASPRG